MEYENEELYFYNSCYNALKKLEKIYLPDFSLDRLINDITSETNEDKRKIYVELLSLRNLFFSVLLGLKKEELESANSLVKQHRLFQYKDYDGDVDVYIDENNSIKWKDFASKMCKKMNFNLNHEGPFPLMLEITKDNNKNRPYDYISKIRNAYLHAEYKLDKFNPDITHIWNTDDDGNVIFKGKILTSTFQMFILDYFGFSNSVGSKYVYYKIPNHEIDEVNYMFDDFIDDFKAIELEFTELPEKYKFSGQKGGVYEQLNSCFGKDTFEVKSICDVLRTLKEEGVKYNEKIIDFPIDKLDSLKEYVLNKDENYYLDTLQADVKLILSPISEITNCFTNLNHYIDFKSIYLTPGNTAPMNLLYELKYDEIFNTSFKYAIAFLKLHLINYAIESKNINEFNYDILDFNDVIINDMARFNTRKNQLILEGYSDIDAHNKLVLEIMRNALAHGGDRIGVTLDANCKVKFIDKYQNLPEVSVETSLNKIDEIFKLFDPRYFNKNAKTKKLSLH